MTKQSYVAIICRLMDALALGEIGRADFKAGMRKAHLCWDRAQQGAASA